MIKIIHIITGLETGGAETMLYKLLSGMDRSLFEPVVLSLAGPGTLGGKIEALGVPVICIGMRRGRVSWAGIRRLRSVVREQDPDILQGWMYHGNLAAQAASLFSRKRVPVVWNIRQSLYSLSYEKKATAAVIKAGGFLARFPDAIVYNSRTSAKQHEAIGYRPDKGVFIPNGFDTDLFAPSEGTKNAVKAELGMPDSALLIGLIGRSHPMKDHAGFLRAAALILEKGPDVHFLLAGTGVDGSNRALRDTIDTLGIAQRVHLLGERDDIPRLTAALDIAVSSSAYGEGFPNVIGEAMSCAVPCVVTDVGDSALVVDDAGMIVPPLDPAALARACLALLEKGKEDRLETGRRGRRRIVEQYSLDAVVLRYQELYQEILNGGTRSVFAS